MVAQGFANNSIGDTVVAVGTISPAVAGMSDAATTFVDKWSAKYTVCTTNPWSACYTILLP